MGISMTKTNSYRQFSILHLIQKVCHLVEVLTDIVGGVQMEPLEFKWIF